MSDYIDEEEIKNYVNDQFKLDLVKDSFTRPTKKVVIELVLKFLEDIVPSGISRSSDQEEIDIFQTFVSLKKQIKDIDTIGIVLRDLIFPARERSTILFNYLILKRAWLYERALPAYKKYCEQCPREQISINLNENEKLKGEIEELQYKLSKKKSRDELLKLRDERKATLEEKKKEGESLAEEAKRLKQLCSEKQKLIDEIRQKSDFDQLERDRQVTLHINKMIELFPTDNVTEMEHEYIKLKSLFIVKNKNINTTYDKPTEAKPSEYLEIASDLRQKQLSRIEEKRKTKELQDRIGLSDKKIVASKSELVNLKQKRLAKQIEDSKLTAELQQKLANEESNLQKILKEKVDKVNQVQQAITNAKRNNEEVNSKRKHQKEKYETSMDKFDRLRIEGKKYHELFMQSREKIDNKLNLYARKRKDLFAKE